MNLKSVFMSMFAIAALASCSNDEEVPGGVNQGEKASSWIGVSVSLPASAFSRAADGTDANAEDLETAIKNISLYYQKTDGSVDAVATTFAVGDFTPSSTSTGTVYTATKAALVPFAKGTTVTLYAAANTPSANSFMPNWFNRKGTAGDPNVNYWTALSSDLSNEADGFTMTGEGQGTTFETEEGAKAGTHAPIVINRAVAKVLVTASNGAKFDPTTDFEETNVNGASGKFQANSLMWTIGNNNKKLFLLADDNGKDPNWETLTGTAGLDDEYDNRQPSSYTMAVPKYDAGIVTGYEGGTFVQYCNENTNETYQYGNTTFISVQAVFVPNMIVKTVTFEDGKPVLKAEKNDLGVGDFYYYPEELKYLTKTAFDEAIANGLSADEFKGVYEGGKCYYFVPVKNSANELGVKRNTYYTMRINSLKAPGDPTPNSGEEIDPVEQKSWISVDFEVANWDPQSMGDLDLE